MATTKFAIGAQSSGFIGLEGIIEDKCTYSPSPLTYKVDIPKGMINIGGNGKGYIVPRSLGYDFLTLVQNTNYIIYAVAPSSPTGTVIIRHDTYANYIASGGDNDSQRAIGYFRTHMDGSDIKIIPETLRTFASFDNFVNSTSTVNQDLDLLKKAGFYYEPALDFKYRGQFFDEQATFEAGVTSWDLVYKNTSGNYDKSISDDTEKEVVIGLAEIARDSITNNDFVLTSGIIDIGTTLLPNAIFPSGTYLYLSNLTAGKIVRDFDNWAPSTVYSVGDKVLEEGDSSIYYVHEVTEITGSGQSAAGSLPSGFTNTSGLGTSFTDNEVTWISLAVHEESYLGERKIRIGTSLGDGVLLFVPGGTALDDHEESAYAHQDLQDAMEKAGLYVLNTSQGKTTWHFKGQYTITNATWATNVTHLHLVYLDSTTDKFERSIADGTAAETMLGVAFEENGIKYVVLSGLIEADLSAYDYGEKLYLHQTNAGEFTSSGASGVQIGTVVIPETAANGGCFIMTPTFDIGPHWHPSYDNVIDLGKFTLVDALIGINFHSDTTYGNPGDVGSLQIYRDATVGSTNADSNILHRGTGEFIINLKEAGDFIIKTTDIERFRVKDDGLVGIGTTDPTKSLHIYGTAVTMTLESTDTNGTTALQIANPSSGGANSIQFGSKAESVLANSFAYISADNSTFHFNVRRDGNVGIGTTIPGNKLDIITGTTLDCAIHIGEFVNQGGYIASTFESQLYLSGGSEFSTSHYARATTASAIALGDGTILFRCNTGLTPGVIFTPGDKMILDSAGNLGIGSIVPTSLLQINSISESNPGGVHADPITVLKLSRGGTITYAYDESAEFRIGHGGPGAYGSQIDIYINGVTNTDDIPDQHVMTWDYTGYVGIGTTEPNSILHIYSAVSLNNPQMQINDTFAFNASGSGVTETVGIARNAYFDGSNWERIIADNEASAIVLSADGSISFRVATDALATAGSIITFSRALSILKNGNSEFICAVDQVTPQIKINDTFGLVTTDSAGAETAAITRNAYYDGTNWRRIIAQNSTSAIVLSPSNTISFRIPTDALDTADSIITYTKALVITADGKVGIGTDSPSGRLSILNALSNIYCESTSFGSSLHLIGEAGYDQFVRIKEDGVGKVLMGWDSSASLFKIEHTSSIVFSENDFVIASNGNIGMGSGNPGQSLDIYSTTLSTSIKLKSTTWGSKILLMGATGKDNHLEFLENSARKAMIGWDASEAVFKITHGTGGFTDNHFVVASGGKVGVGTNSPVSNLDVYPQSGDSYGFITVNAFKTEIAETDWLCGFWAQLEDNCRLEMFAMGPNTDAYGAHFENRGLIQVSGGDGLSFTSPGDVRFYAGGSGTTDEAIRFTSTGGVGIGTVTAAIGLIVYNATTNALIQVKSIAHDAGLILTGDTDFDSFVRFQEGGTTKSQLGWDASSDLFKINGDSNGFASNHFVINASGYVGIGTTNPTYLIRNHELTGSNPGGVHADPITVLKLSRYGTVSYAYNESAEFRIGHGGPGLMGSQVDIYINSVTNTTDIPDQHVMTWDYTGYVGIGTTNPDEELHIYSTTYPVLKLHAVNDYSAYVEIFSEDIRKGIVGVYNTHASLKLSHKEAGTSLSDDQLVIKEGQVGIGTSNPTSHLHIYDSAGWTMVTIEAAASSYSAAINFTPSGSITAGDPIFLMGEKADQHGKLQFWRYVSSHLASDMVIDADGNIGIGTTIPGNKLDLVTGAGTTSSSFHLGEAVDEGAYFYSGEDHQIIMTAGSEYVDGIWLARSTASCMISFYDGEISFRTNYGLTDGVTFSPSTKMLIHQPGNVEFNINVSLDVPQIKINDTFGFHISGSDASETVGITRNAYFDGSWKRIILDNEASAIVLSADGSISFRVATDAGTAADSVITLESVIRILDTGNVGIGTDTATNATVHIEGPRETTYNIGQLVVQDSTDFDTGVGGSITFFGKVNSGGSYGVGAGIWAEKDNAVSDNYGFSLNLGSRTHGISSISSDLTITSAGNVGIGTTAPANSNVGLTIDNPGSDQVGVLALKEALGGDTLPAFGGTYGCLFINSTGDLIYKSPNGNNYTIVDGAT